MSEREEAILALLVVVADKPVNGYRDWVCFDKWASGEDAIPHPAPTLVAMRRKGWVGDKGVDWNARTGWFIRAAGRRALEASDED